MTKKYIYSGIVLVLAGTAATICFSGDKTYVPRSKQAISGDILAENEEKETFGAEAAQYLNWLRADPKTGVVNPADYYRAVEASNHSFTKRLSKNLNWSELGPDNVGGRMRAFLQDKDDPNLMFAGSVSGGLFISKTRGGSWKPVNDMQENLNVCSITQTIDGTIYYGTGEGQFVNVNGTEFGSPGFIGSGIFKSTDKGETFTRLTNTSAFGDVSYMAADITTNRIYAGTSTGLRYSDNGGTNWQVARSGNCREIQVASNGTVYAHVGNGLFRSFDGATNYINITPPGASVGRLSIAISPEDPNYIYTMVGNNSNTLDGVYRSTDKGDNWTKIINGGSVFFDPLSQLLSDQGQGYYNNVISVDPDNKDHIYMGGVSLAEWRLGQEPKIIASTIDVAGNRAYVHADKHVMYWDHSTSPKTFIVGTDGGLFVSRDKGITFSAKSQGFNTVQFYGLAADYNGNVVGGSQDNGTQYINKKGNTERSAVEIKGGDGFQAEISMKNPSIIFAETYYGNISRSRENGKNMTSFWDRRIRSVFSNRLTDTAKYNEFSHLVDFAPFNTMFRLWEHPDSNQSRLFIALRPALSYPLPSGYNPASAPNKIWMAVNPTDFNNNVSWFLVSSTVGTGYISDIEYTPDGNTVFVAGDVGVFRIDGLNTAIYSPSSPATAIPAGITTTNITGNLPLGRSITSFNLDPNDPNKAVITIGNYGLSNYVYKTSNALDPSPTYTNITSNLPAMPVYDAVINIENPNYIILGTDLGVYASDNGGASWEAQNTGMAKVPVFVVRQYYWKNHNKGAIYIATHGRGFYESKDFYSSLSKTQKAVSSSLKLYPNPATDVARARFTLNQSDNVKVEVIDISGKTVYSEQKGLMEQGDNEVAINTANFQAGNYFVKITGIKTSMTAKLVVIN